MMRIPLYPADLCLRFAAGLGLFFAAALACLCAAVRAPLAVAGRSSRLSVLALALLPAVAPAPATADPAADLASAYTLMRRGNWPAALEAAGPAGSLGRDIILWHRLRTANGGAGFTTDRDFLARRPNWPGEPYTRRMGERVISDADDAARVQAYFSTQLPQSGAGVLQLIRANLALGRRSAAEAEAVRAWRGMQLSAAEEDRLLSLFPELLPKHDQTRIEMLLWQGEAGAAERLLPRLPGSRARLAAARIGLRNSVDGVDALIAAVPAALAADPGLAWDRYQWRKRKNRPVDALALLRERSVSADALGRPEAWSRDRRSIARDLMRRGEPLVAYEVASRHHLPPGGSDYADLEWLAGYIALRFLGDAEQALEHFTHLRMAVMTPISLGRAGYWEGRALEAMGQPVDAQAAYEFGAEFQTSFYGLLAAEKAGLPMDPALLGQEQVPDWKGAPFQADPLMQAGLLLLAAGDLDLAERFMRHLCESLDAVQMAQMADQMLAMDEPHLALRIAKFAADQGITLNRPYYPLHPLAKAAMPDGVPVELALSIARRESEFDPVVVSPVGARGLMQVMPKTAEEVAGKLGIEYVAGKLTSDPEYNARLGTAYLSELVGRFGPNWVLVSAAYNAGPSRPLRWLGELGDLRDGDMDPVDWIEAIPFEETRNYVMRVTESLPVYRARLAGKVVPIGLTQALTAR